MFQLQTAAAALTCKGGSCTTYAGRAMDSGYPADWFTDTVPPELLCEICGKVLQCPRQTRCCSNSFCLHCLEFWIEYYGICPKRCGEIDRDSLGKDTATEKAVLALTTRCKYQVYGCPTSPQLANKTKHEKKCSFRSKTDALLRPATTAAAEEKDQQLDSYVEMASVVASRKTTVNPAPNTSDLVYHTYRLKRKIPGESLGFVLVAGAKNSNGKAVNFSIKSITLGTLAAEVGLQPGDKIVQVDDLALSQLQQQDAVSRIKSSPVVTLTVIRGRAKKQGEGRDHIYEDVLYSDIPTTTEITETPYRDRSGSSTEMVPSRYKSARQDDCRIPRSSKVLTQKISADSGLSSSSGSAHSPHKHHLLRTHDYTHHDHTHHSYHSERELMKKYLHDRKPNIDAVIDRDRDIRIEGDYELEEIFLQKNGTNQLGITLGYDAKSTAGRLFVCDIISSGLAAKDGRLQKGDIVKKVNGFDVYDPEEAVLLFLEQDQDITLSVARKMKVQKRRALLGKNSQSHGSLASAVHSGEMRRTDSCGSLDSHTHCENDILLPQRHNSEISPYKGSASPEGHTFTPPTITSSGYETGCDTSAVTTDYTFRPINEIRSSTVQGRSCNELKRPHKRSTTSLGSDRSAPTPSLNPRPPVNYPMSRHQSIDSQRLYRSPSPKYGHYHSNQSHAINRSVSRLRTESLV